MTERSMSEVRAEMLAYCSEPRYWGEAVGQALILSKRLDYVKANTLVGIMMDKGWLELDRKTIRVRTTAKGFEALRELEASA